MNEVVSKMISTQALLFIYGIVGVIVSKAGIIKQDNRKVLVRLLMDVCVPFMVLSAFNRSYTKEELTSSLVIMVMAAAFCIVSGLLGVLLFRKQPARRKSVLQYAIMFSNAGMAGLPVVSLVFGEMGVFYASMYLIPPRILQWTVGVSLFAHNKEKGSLIKNVLLNPVVVVVYIGLLLMLTNWQIPGVPAMAIKEIGNMTAPLSMILLGATLSNMNVKMLADKQVWFVSVIRLLIIPLTCIVSLRYAGIDPLILSVCTTLLAMPVASNTATIAERYDGDFKFASACVSVSTILSVLTVPLITWIIQLI